MTIGVLGIGFLGSFVANQIKKLGYNVIGFKKIKMETKKTVIGKNNLVAIFQINKT